ncbi:DUF3999 domain-containing protein [Accumulibacter sp.]|uniref:DUF3999 domain-containing protein n=1 Tax=Accumulibacter sp. TaxID=2053492 RepID=UPI0025DFCE17|nr:DUF3999 domain-containing protein [Accumulibacter sp.]MCM8611387.1 DUF3999 domain-containing protein [Accumulibacter sp.]MCM8634966.1 DUF3999 domain-containing protein [Accumulibacter sp.]MCM8639754.1 DUF3999 domain-containing protein [Accumulibacter sp.]
MKRILAGWLWSLWSVLALAEAPGDFAFGMLLQADGPQPLLRVDLPAAVHAGVRRPDLGDLRVFNAAGEAVPYAWLPQPTAPRSRPPLLPLPVFALRGDATAGVEGVEVRIERQGGRAVLRMDGRAGASAPAMLLGYLVDASAVGQPLQALALELPAKAEDIFTRVRVEASDDLARWTTLVGDAPVLRLAAGGQRLDRLRIDFAPRRAKYFRLRWAANAAPLQLSAVGGEPAASVVELPRQWRQVAGRTVPDEAGSYRFDLAGQFPADRLRLLLPQPNSVAAVELLSRARDPDPWRQVATATVYRLGAAGQEVVSPEIVIAANGDRHWLLRVDQRGGGLGAGVPELAAGWLTRGLVFAARGPAPFQLAFGSHSAQPTAYPITTLVPGFSVGDDGQPVVGAASAAGLGIGRATTGAVHTLAGEGAGRVLIDWRVWGLWASLLLAVGLLAGMAWRLARQLVRSPRDGPAG